MKKILKILKKYSLGIIAVIVLLFIQAMCDLSLPDYTAKIVNVGIGQNGIEESVPKVIKEETLDNVLLFASDEETEDILKHYSLISKNNLSKKEYEDYLAKYPSLAKENLYLLNDLTDEQLQSLEQNFQIPYLVLTTLTTDDTKIKEQLKQMFPQMNSETNIIDILSTLDKSQLTNIRQEFSKELTDIDDSLIDQMTIASLKVEYEEIGIDISKLQTNYIINVGLKLLKQQLQ